MEGKHKEAGPAFCDIEGFVISSNVRNKQFHQALSNLQLSRPDLITPDVVVTEAYNVYRSFRCGATMRAREAKVPKDIIEVNNRWNKVERKMEECPECPWLTYTPRLGKLLLLNFVSLNHFR